jgi:ABC-type lipoprotein release transport system permease subunit
VLAQAVRLAAAGAVGGLVAAIAVSRVLSGVLFGISATDPRTFCAVAAFLFMVAIAAAWHPAQKATRADPVSALRVE